MEDRGILCAARRLPAGTKVAASESSRHVPLQARRRIRLAALCRLANSGRTGSPYKGAGRPRSRAFSGEKAVVRGRRPDRCAGVHAQRPGLSHAELHQGVATRSVVRDARQRKTPPDAHRGDCGRKRRCGKFRRALLCSQAALPLKIAESPRADLAFEARNTLGCVRQQLDSRGDA